MIRKGSQSATLSLPEARRLAVASQGFGERPAKATIVHIHKLAARIHAFQIDSVNVVVRAHYMPAFARLGPYPMAMLDALAYQKRELFEYWGHAACLMPMSLYPLVRYRMHTDETREYMRSSGGAYMAKVYTEVAERGPMSAGDLADPGKREKGWWSWWGTNNGKATLEHLYDAGLVAIAGRRGFERLYDIAERVIPQAARDAPAPPREDAMKQLICLAAQACGVGTLGDITAYFYTDAWHDRLPRVPRWERVTGADGKRSQPIAKRLVAELLEEGRLLAARVEGWKEPAYLHPNAKVPKSVAARALVTPFDSLVWERRRIARLFGMKYSIELYTPAPRRVYGYYVFPFLLGDTLVGRCDLKADRQRKVLMVQGSFLEPAQKAKQVAPHLAAELRLMRDWLQLDRIEVSDRGNLASTLRTSLKTSGSPRSRKPLVR
ncbi:MAG TPA: crosslink repair DNA glycosylase YcaQ family protein [Gemmatimonadaceae bacterium]|nr:crosslink repair DNA glycosylase YcaQ family protein [Gemmatimonadaceae bacterium]